MLKFNKKIIHLKQFKLLTSDSIRGFSKTHYQILKLSPNSSEQQIKSNFRKLAKQYHPDRYKGKNTDQFKKIMQAYSILRNPIKRKQYDIKMSIHQKKFNSKRKQKFKGFNVQDIDDEILRKNRERYTRSDIDPEFLAQLKTQNFMRQFNQFNKRPLRNQPGNFQLKKLDTIQSTLSKKQLSRRNFVRMHTLKAKEARTIKFRIMNKIDQKNQYLETSYGRLSEKKKYNQLVEEIFQNKQLKNTINNQVAEYKNKQQQIQLKREKAEKVLKQTQKKVWGFYFLAFVIWSCMMYGARKQMIQLHKGNERANVIDKISSIQTNS